MAVKRYTPIREQFFDSNGDPLAGGKLFFYAAGSSTKQNTFNSSAGSVANANPLVLDNVSGRPNSEIWMTTGQTYKVVLTSSTDGDPPTSPIWTEDVVAGINDASLTLDEWVTGPAPTYVSSTSFTVVGDQTSTLTVGRRVKITDAGGTKYGTIKTSAYTSLTTITLDSQDSDALATPTSALSYGLFNPTNTSHPVFSDALAVVGGSADRSKRLRFEVDGFTTATTRVLTVQDSDDTIVGRATTDTLTNKTLTSPTLTAPVLNGALSGDAIAAQAEMETGTATDSVVTPGNQKYHPGMVKGWCKATDAGVATVSYNVTSVTDVGTGRIAVVWATDFATTNYVAGGTSQMVDSAVATLIVNNTVPPVAGQTDFINNLDGGAAADPVAWHLWAMGDQ